MDTPPIPSHLRLRTAYGYFDEGAREYVITRPDTPTPWINYLGEGRYGGIISNTAGGFSFDRDPRNRRVTRYRYNGVPADQPGRYVYLRDRETGEYWSPTWQPIVSRSLETYECRHGAGYTRISSCYHGIEASLLYFVPPRASVAGAGARETGDGQAGPPCELWVLRVKNVGERRRKLRSFSYVEFSYFDAVTDQQNLDWGMHILHARETGGILQVTTKFDPTVSFFASSAPHVGFDTDRESFLGRYRDLSNPEVVEVGKPSQSQAPRGNNIGSLAHDFDLAPGEQATVVYILGVTDQPSEIAPLVERYRDLTRVDAAFDALRADWKQYLDRFTIDTPDPATNAMLNFWNQVQCRTTLYWSRFVSAYETGLGRGMGTRDTGQDTLGTMHTVPEHARDLLTRIWRLQFNDGHTWHQFMPLTGEGGPGLAAEFPKWPQWFCDDHLWLVISVCAYLRETGDFAYLEQRVPYADGGDDTVWGHMMRAVDFTLNHLGPHGLPRIGFADWDDTLNIDHGGGKAESVFCAQQFCRALVDLAELAGHLGKGSEAARFRALKEEMADRVNRVAWDGAWYARAYDDEGRPLGVASEKTHKIGLNTQTWSVLGEVADRARAERAMQSVHEKLNTPVGVALLWPAYDGADPRVRGTATYPPGAKENGGIFCHANAWVIVAAAMLGMGDRAFEYYRQILPLSRADSDNFAVEPYVYCQNICGPEHPQFGRGRNAWLTGTAAWTFVAGTQWILGIRPTFDGLRIAPVIPSSWNGFRARRMFRGVVHDIVVERVGSGNAVSLTVDGAPVQGDVVPLPQPGASERKILVRLGTPAS